MAKAILRANVSFSAFGKDYTAGDSIPQADVQKWPREALRNRLNSNDVEWDSDVDDATDDDESGEKGKGAKGAKTTKLDL